MRNIIRNFTFILASFLLCLSQGCKKPEWVSQVSGYSHNLLGVRFTDSNTGTVVGVAGTIPLDFAILSVITLINKIKLNG